MTWRSHQLFLPVVLVLVFSTILLAPAAWGQSEPKAYCKAYLSIIEKAEALLSDGSLGKAEAILQTVTPLSCPLVAAKLATTMVDLALSKQALMQDVQLALVDCNINQLSSARRLAVESGLVLSAQETQRIARVSNGLRSVHLQLDQAKTQLREGSLPRADEALSGAEQRLDELRGETNCSAPRSTIATLRSQADELKKVIHQGQDILQTCQIDAIARQKSALLALELRPAAVGNQIEVLDAAMKGLRRVALAQRLSSRRSGKENFRAAADILDKASTILDTNQLEQCDQLRAQIDDAFEENEQLAMLSETSETALQSCKMTDLRKAKVGLLRSKTPGFADRMTQIDVAIDLSLGLQAARAQIDTGQFEPAKLALEELQTKGKDRDAQICPGLDDAITAVLEDQLDLKAQLSVLTQAKSYCSTSEIQSSLRSVQGNDPALVEMRQTLNNRIKAIEEITRQNQIVPVRLRGLTSMEKFKSTLEEWEFDPDSVQLSRQCPDIGGPRKTLIADAWQVLSLVEGLNREMTTTCYAMEALDLSHYEQRYSGYVLFEKYRSEGALLRRALTPVMGRELDGAVKAAKYELVLVYLREAIAGIDRKPKTYCANTERPLRPDLMKLQTDVLLIVKSQAQIPKLSRSCDMSQLDSVMKRFRKWDEDKTYPVAFKKERTRLMSIQSMCRDRKARERRIAMGKTCKAKLGNHYRLVGTGTSLRCGCQSPYVLSSENTACKKPHSLLVKEANASCLKSYGGHATAFEVKPDGSSRCRCDKGYVFNDAVTRCFRPTGTQLRKLADKWCQRDYGKLSRSTNVKSVENFQCDCAKGARWTKKQDRCYRPNRAQLRKEAVASCRKEYGRRYLRVSRRKNGQYLCHFKHTRAQAMRWCRNRHGNKVRTVRFNKSGSKYWCIFK